MEPHLKAIGILLMALASVHIIFPKYFNWKEELRALSLINRQMMLVHTFFIVLTVFLMVLIISSPWWHQNEPLPRRYLSEDNWRTFERPLAGSRLLFQIFLGLILTQLFYMVNLIAGLLAGD